MEWLTRWWRELFRDVLLTGSGLVVIGSQVIAAHPSPELIAAGLGLTVPSTIVKLREIAGDGGSSSPSSRPAGSSPPSHGSGSTDE